MDLANWLSALGARIDMQINRYDGARLIEQCREPEGVLEAAGAAWECSLTVTPAVDRPDAVDIEARFKLSQGRAAQISAGLCITFEDWSTDRYVCMPSAVYAGNRFDCRPLPYAPILDSADRGKDVPVIITDVPRLNIAAGPSRIQQLTRDLSTPAVGLFDPAARKGFWLLTDPNTRLGDSGIDLQESDDRSIATLSVTAPGVREGLRYCGNSFSTPSDDRGADFEPGDEVTLRLRLFAFDCQDIPALFDRFVDIRTDLTGPGTIKHRLPFSAAWAIQEEKFNRDNWTQEGGYYSVGLRENMYQDWQIGWTGGLMSTHPLLMAGDDVSRRRALHTFDFLFDGGQGDAGFFYGCGHHRMFYGDDFGNPEDRGFHLIRKSADALYFLLKQFDLLDKQGQVIPAHWEAGARRVADAFVRLWDENRQFGQFVDADTGQIIIGGSTSAGVAPAGLALAHGRYGNPDYLRVAEAAARQYYERDVLSGATTGGPGEILQCPDSESAFGLLESFVVLYEGTGQREWVDKAQDMARQCASWCVSYDWPFPPDSLFGRLDVRSAGAVWANVQNKHGAPGICTLSGDSLWKLFRATGERLYLDMLRDTAHNLTQYLSRTDRPVGEMPSGWMNERVNLSDWDDNVGGVIHGSCWCEVSCMLTYAEAPSIYVQPDTGLLVAFDHVDVELEGVDAGEVRMRITNPTKFEARLRIFVEPSTNMSRPLGQNTLWGLPTVVLAPGETKSLRAGERSHG